MKKIIICLLFLSLFLCGCSDESTSLKSGDVISYDEAIELVSDGAVIVDVRTLDEYEVGHIDGAILMSIDTINEEVAKDNIKSKDTNVIVYCRSGSRSKQAAQILNNLGYKNVYDLGSINNWK